jgi:hypothetical protein
MNQSNPNRMSVWRSRRLWWLVFLFLEIIVVAGVFQARQWARSEYGTQDARGQWQHWRDDVARQPGNSPVSRTVPRSQEPPALVLLGDYFWISMLISVVLSAALYGTFVFIILGILNSRSTG